jgi:MFS family permease
MKKIHYGWVMVAVTFCILIVGAGIRSMPSVLMVPLETEFGWNRSVVSSSLAINLLLYGLFGPFAAAFMLRFGMKRVTLFALVLLVAGVFSTLWIHEPWQLNLLWGVMIGIGSGSTVVLSTLVANRWFVSKRGLVIGVLTASGATGQIIFLPFLAKLVTDEGWKLSIWAVSICIAAVFFIVFILMKNHPGDLKLAPFGSTAIINEPLQTKLNPFKQPINELFSASKSLDFWLLAGSFFICGFSTNGLIGTHFIPACLDHGISEVKAASMLATIGIFDIFGTMLSGILSDRFNNRWLLFWYYGLRGISLLFLPFALDTSHFYLWFFIIFYGLDWVATVPPTIKLTSDIFGKERAGILFGWIMAAHQIGASIAAFSGGLLHDMLGSYYFSFLTAGAFCVVASLIVMKIGRTSKVTLNESSLQA